MARSSPRPDLSNLVLRVIAAAVLLPLAVAMAWLGGWMFAVFLALCAAAMGWEVAAMARGLMCYPMPGAIDGVHGDHILLAPPYIIEEAEVGELVNRLGDAIDAALMDAGVQGTL